MGTYVVNQDVIDRVGNTRAVQLTTDTGTVVDTALIDKRIDEAEGEAHGYIAKQYAVPVDLVAHPEMLAALRGFVLDLTIHRLDGRRPPVSEASKDARKAAIDWLTKVAAGTIKLPTATTPASTNANDPVSGHGNYRNNAGVENIL